MPIVKYSKKKIENKIVGITELDFGNGYKKNFLLGKILVDFVEFNYQNALESIRGLMDFILQIIKPDLTIDKFKEFMEIDIFDLEQINNWDKFEFPENENEKYFNEFSSAIRQAIQIFIHHNPLYIEYMTCFDNFIKDREIASNAFSLLIFLNDMEKHLSNDKELAIKYRTAMDYCLDKDGVNNDLTPKIRFLIYGNSDYITDRVKFMKLSYIDNIKSVKKKKIKLTGVKWKDYEYSFCQVYVTNIEKTIYLEFRNLLTNEITLRKCKNCKRYFVGTDRSKNLLYCNRKVSGSDKTCEDVGSMNVYQEKIQENPILAIWKKAKDRNRKREENEKITPYEYGNWIIYGEKIKDKAEKGEISLSEFEKIMNYNIEETKKWIITIKKEKEGE